MNTSDSDFLYNITSTEFGMEYSFVSRLIKNMSYQNYQLFELTKYFCISLDS